jgi:hypothetical protein
MLSSLTRRAVCPNFILTHGVSGYVQAEPCPPLGFQTTSGPKGGSYVKGKQIADPVNLVQPTLVGSSTSEWICTEGDAEEFVKRHPGRSALGFE